MATSPPSRCSWMVNVKEDPWATSIPSGPKITIPVACAGESRAHLSWGQGGECHGSASRILNALCSRSGLTVSQRGWGAHGWHSCQGWGTITDAVTLTSS